MHSEEYYMNIALSLAGKALAEGEFPVGCVIVADGEIVAEGKRSNSTGKAPNEIDHAEIQALRNFSDIPREFNRGNVAIYSTMEPCLMCYGAILISGIGKIVYAYEDAMGGGTACNRKFLPPLYRERRISIARLVLRNESLKLFADFFKNPQNQYLKDSLLAKYTLDQDRLLANHVASD
jgi:tRNA(adenine34) deaminase